MKNQGVKFKMVRIITTITAIIVFASCGYSQNTIAEARALPLGTTVTVRGIVTNGSELGIIRYLQDATAGIAAYGSAMSAVQRGDSVTVTGVLKDYNKLLELDPISSVTVLADGKPLPVPEVITPSQMNESREAELVKIHDVVFSNAGNNFAGNTNYTVTANGETTQVRINNSSPLVGQVIPSGEVTLVGICSQFSYTSATSGYQLLLRDENDIISNSSISIITPISVTGITTSQFTLGWETNIAGTTELFYGFTPQLEIGHLEVAGTGTGHSITVTGANPSDLFYVKAFSVAGSDTGFSVIRPFITGSVSSGDIKVYFTGTVDHSVSSGVDAVYLNESADDTIIEYINRAKYSVDVAIYNFSIDGISNIATALNAAYNRGVTVRVITDGSAANIGIASLVSGIKTIERPDGDGIMHDKFMVIDLNSPDPDEPVVWAGSCNWTAQNINQDANNLLFIQDQSLAEIYELEFEEMWGSSTANPNPANAKFGIDKTDNTPHELVINGKRVEIYFSPSDGVNAEIINHINDADNDMQAGTMLITRTDIGYAIDAQAGNGIDAKVVVNSQNECNTTVVETLAASLGNKFREYNEAGILHNKYLIVDQVNSSSDPFILTGSHNWSSSADQKNDENTLVIHDPVVANLFYQEFTERYNNGTPVNPHSILNLGPDQEVCGDVAVTLDAGPFDTYNWSTGDLTRSITVDSSGIGYGTKKIWCRVTDQWGLQSDTVNITFKNCAGIREDHLKEIRMYPNPCTDRFYMSFISDEQEMADITLLRPDGVSIWKSSGNIHPGENLLEINPGNVTKGLYLIKIRTTSENIIRRVVIR